MVPVLFHFGLCVYLVRHWHAVDGKSNLKLKLNDTYTYTYVGSDSEHQRRRQIDVGATYTKFQVEISVRETASCAYIHPSATATHISYPFVHLSSCSRPPRFLILNKQTLLSQLVLQHLHSSFPPHVRSFLIDGAGYSLRCGAFSSPPFFFTSFVLLCHQTENDTKTSGKDMKPWPYGETLELCWGTRRLVSMGEKWQVGFRVLGCSVLKS